MFIISFISSSWLLERAFWRRTESDDALYSEGAVDSDACAGTQYGADQEPSTQSRCIVKHLTIVRTVTMMKTGSPTRTAMSRRRFDHKLVDQCEENSLRHTNVGKDEGSVEKGFVLG